MSNKKFTKVLIGSCVGLFALILIMKSIQWSIPQGTVGVVTSFGKVQEETLKPGGPYLVGFWKNVQTMDVRTQKNEENATVPTKGGLAVQMKAVLIYHLNEVNCKTLFSEVGQDYEAKLIDPIFKNCVRDSCAGYEPEALYGTERNKVETEALVKFNKEMERRGIIGESVMFQDPVLPSSVTDRIQAKIGAEQDAIRMQSVLKSKKLEADAKVIEAKGIAEAQAIVKKDLDDNYLIYLWIEALKESAKHNNATIYVPTGQNGMPLMLNHPNKNK